MESLVIGFIVFLIAAMYLATAHDRRRGRADPGGPSCGYGDTTHSAGDSFCASSSIGCGDGGGGDGGGGGE